MNEWWWSYLLTAVGLTGFFLAGRKVWWAWYINIGCQVLWFAYALITQQYGFIVAAFAYTFVFTQNAVKWTRERPPRRNYEDEHRRAVHAQMAREVSEGRWCNDAHGTGPWTRRRMAPMHFHPAVRPAGSPPPKPPAMPTRGPSGGAGDSGASTL